MVEDADALELAVLVHIVEDHLVHDDDVALFPLRARPPLGRSALHVELGDKLYAELPVARKEGAHVQDLSDVGGKSLIVGDELLRAV